MITNKIIIRTYIGMCCDAKHYYGDLIISDMRKTIELTRPITINEIKSNKDRFYCYHEGDLTNCFKTWKEVIISGREKAVELGLSPNNIMVYGFQIIPK